MIRIICECALLLFVGTLAGLLAILVMEREEKK